mgnify:CR=1 FL=1
MTKKAILITSLSSNSGKTFISTGLICSFIKKGLTVAAFKCGPDYIDTAILSKASRASVFNLDTILMNRKTVKELFFRQLQNNDIAVIEGVMGFLDGVISKKFRASTFDIACLLEIPVIFIIDAKSMAESVAIIIKGIEYFSKSVYVAGIILNNVASTHHKKLLVNTIKNNSYLKILGAIPVMDKSFFHSRHLGLKTALETPQETLEKATEVINNYIDIDSIIELSAINIKKQLTAEFNKTCKKKDKIACLAYDRAFSFYYASNIEFLENAGYKICFFSPLKDEAPADCDLIYIGGGYPELYTEELEINVKTKAFISEHFHKNKKIFAECGGFMYLSRHVIKDDKSYNMVNLFDIDFTMKNKRQALGYVNAKFVNDTFFAKKGAKTKGHIFHYSTISKNEEKAVLKLKKLSNGEIFDDGYLKKSAFAGYTHYHFLSKNNFIVDFLK